jgi:steroid 5-alpha reductase family enzyme
MLSHLLEVLVICLVIIIMYAVVAFSVSRWAHRSDVADVAWGIGFIIIALTSLSRSGLEPTQRLVTILVAIWGLRLARHIFVRLRRRPEDKRYVEMRAKWGNRATLRTFTDVFLGQAALTWLVAMPVIIINATAGSGIGVLAAIGAVIWLVGFGFESIGDKQLGEFIASPANKGRLLTTGLWSYTRHPNYFGEVTQWWGIWVIALAVPYGWLGIIGPLTISFLILKVSGVPLLERAYAGRADWEAYKARTSVFIPLPPRKPQI